MSEISRRDFLKFSGLATLTFGTSAACGELTEAVAKATEAPEAPKWEDLVGESVYADFDQKCEDGNILAGSPLSVSTETLTVEGGSGPDFSVTKYYLKATNDAGQRCKIEVFPNAPSSGYSLVAPNLTATAIFGEMKEQLDLTRTPGADQ